MADRFHGLLAEEQSMSTYAYPSESRGSAEAPLPVEHMTDVCRFLPELATELATAQTSQDVEVEQKQQQLLHLKDELKKENEQLKSVVACVCSANRAITLAQARTSQASLSCQNLEKTIATLVAEREDLQGQLERVSREREGEEKRRGEYGRKMERHRDRVSYVEQDSTAFRELAELQAKKQQLEDKRVTSIMHGAGLQILSGERQKQLQESIIAAETAGVLLDEETDQIRQKRKLGEQQVQRWRKEVEMSRKRRQAQLTRLHRQLQEAQTRRREWGKQVDSLRRTVSQLQQKLTDELS